MNGAMLIIYISVRCWTVWIYMIVLGLEMIYTLRSISDIL